jgi:hypothetical protein
MIMLYLQAFGSWVSHMRLNGSNVPLRDLRPGRTSRFKVVRGIVAFLSLLVWGCCIIGAQAAVNQTVAAIVEFQKSAARPK